MLSQVKCTGETRNLYGRFLFGRRKQESSIKKGFKQNENESSGFIWLRIRIRLSEYGTEPSGSTKCEYILDQLVKKKKKIAPRS